MDVSLSGGGFAGQHLDFFFSAARDTKAAKGFLLKILMAPHTSSPRVHQCDKNAAYPKALAELKEADFIPNTCALRRVKYLNDLVEQDHRFSKRLTKPGMSFFSFETAWRTLQGFEVLNMIRKRQVQGMDKGDVEGQVAWLPSCLG